MLWYSNNTMTKSKKYHLSVSLSPASIEYVNSLEAESFSAGLDKLIMTHRHSVADFKRADNIAMLKAAAQVLQRDCNCPQPAIVAWAREAVREVGK